MNAKKRKIAETEYAAVVVERLMTQGWEVYQEVPVTLSDRADIVAVNRTGRIIWIVEVKTTFNYRLMWQARRWLEERADYVSVALPEPRKRTKERESMIEESKKRGIGILYVDLTARNCREILRPLKQEITPYYGAKHDRLFDLPEEFKTFCPAGSKGGYLTAYKVTCLNLVAYAKEHPGVPLREAVKNVSHHYCSDNGAVGTISKWGVIGADLVLCIFPKKTDASPGSSDPAVEGISTNSIEKEQSDNAES